MRLTVLDSLAVALLTGPLLSLSACSGSAHGKSSATLDAAVADDLDAGPDGQGAEEASTHDAESARDAQSAGDARSAHDREGDAPLQVTPGMGPKLSFRQSSGASWEGTGSFAVEVIASAASSLPLSIKLISGGTAQAGSDYQLASDLTLAAGSTTARVMISLIDDHTREAAETLILSLEGTEPAARYTLDIADDDDDRWPGDESVSVVDGSRAFPGENLSGLVYQPARDATPALLWMVRNSPAQLYRLTQNGALFEAPAGEWSAGKTLVFPSGSGAPDSEGISLAEWSSPLLYVVSERDGNGGSAPSLLAYDTSRTGATLTATRAWSLSSDLSALGLGANTGPEALAWVPDSYLTSAGFLDEATGKDYDPARYPNHAGGLFLVGIEQTGGIYAYALDHSSGGFTRVAAIESGHPGLMALEFDRDVNYLWAWCDDTCGNQATILRVEDNAASPRKGRFGVRRRVQRPSGLPNVNNEGMSIGPNAECQNDKKSVFWVEDGSDDHVLRRGSVACGAFLGP